MPIITSFDVLDSEIKKVAGRPTVLEALWDGDTQGWFLVLNLYSETGKLIWKNEKVQQLGIVSFGGDIRLFTGQVPSWPEAELAKEWGQKAVEKYGLTFYFPSDKEPDDNCPSWRQRHLAIHCADCGKSILPSKSQYLPKDICYHCHLTREQNERIKKNEYFKDAVFGIYKISGNAEVHRDYSIYNYLLDFKIEEVTYSEVIVIEFTNEKLASLKECLYSEIKNKLTDYKPSDLQAERRKFGHFEMAKFEDMEYELETKFNVSHSTLSSLIYKYRTFEQAVAQNWTYYLQIVRGLSHRDDSVLRFINFESQGASDIESTSKRFGNVLMESEILETLKKLERLGCIESGQREFKITERGRAIL